MNDLKDKKIIVAGGSGLIGAAIIEGFKEIGAKPVNADIRGGDEYYNMHPDYISSLTNILEKYRPPGGNIDVFVNCTYPRDSITANDGLRLTTSTVANHMSLDGGSIINFSSIYGVVGSDLSFYENTSMDMPLQYAQEKAGVIGLVRAVACKYGKFQVRCNAVCPGGVWNHQPDQFVIKYNRRVPLGRMATPEDIVGPVLFYASDRSRYVSGDFMMVDGGFTAL